MRNLNLPARTITQCLLIVFLVLSSLTANAVEPKGLTDQEWLDRGRGLNEKKDFYGLVENQKAWTLVSPQNYQAWFGLGYALLRINQPEQAISAYEKSLQLSPASWETWRQLGFAFGRARRDQDSRNAYSKAVELNPGDDQLWTYLGTASTTLGLSEEAEISYVQALKLNRDNLEAHGGLCVVMATSPARHKPSTTIGVCRELLQKDSTNSSAWYGLAIAYYRTGNRDEMLKHFNRLKNIDPPLADSFARHFLSPTKP